MAARKTVYDGHVVTDFGLSSFGCFVIGLTRGTIGGSRQPEKISLALPIHRSLRFCMLRALHDLGARDHPVFFAVLRTVTFANALERKGRMNGAYAPAFTVRAG
jgi:hypothetical protein